MINKLKFLFPAGLALALAVALLGFANRTSSSRFMVKVSEKEFRARLNELRQSDIDVAGVDVRSKQVYLLVDNQGKKRLQDLGFKLDLKIKELATRGPDAKYKTPEQVAQILAGYAKNYPDLAALAPVGKSLEGRDIVALKITQHAHDKSAGKPTVLFNGMHHAREVMSSEVPLDIASYLLENYGKDPKVTHWVDANEIYVLPMLNVDGNNKVWNEDSYWRKNARGGYGVDINRNYPYAWNTCNGSSGSQDAQDFRGPSAASEPETNALMNFVTEIHPVFDISFHSFSELVIYPYGCGSHSETSAVVDPIGAKIAELIPSDDGSGHYTAGIAPDLLYSVDGSDIDWMYHEQHVIPYVIELNAGEQGFQPDYDAWREKTVSKIRPAWQYLLDRLDGSLVKGNIQESGPVTIHIESLGQTTPFVTDYQVHVDGSFAIVVNPGDYQLTFLKDGKKIRETHIHVDQQPIQI